MDIYQIWTTYNKQWSRYEILAFVGVLMTLIWKVENVLYMEKEIRNGEYTLMLRQKYI